MRHKLPKSAIADLLLLVNFHLPTDVNIPVSAFLLEKAIEPDFSLATKCFYCPSCEFSVETDTDVCQNCSSLISHKDLLKSGNFFILFNLQSSFLKVLAMPGVKEGILKVVTKRYEMKETDFVEDITDGRCYKQLRYDRYDLTCSVNTDGVSIFNSSKCSIWPILISINELEYKLRRKHTMLAGLWFGPKKPSFDTFLRPFVAHCNELSNDGIFWDFHGTTYHSKIIFPMVAADSVARCSLQGIKQFNGQYGCPWCLIKGETLYQDGRRHKWIFPPSEIVRRTKDGFIQNVRTLESNLEHDLDENCFGIKSASQFLLLNQFNIVDGFVFDYMHTCLLGVVKTFTLNWLDSKNHERDFYIGTKQDVISNLFMRCTVPFESNRVTRDLNDIAFWKANEWKTWMLTCIPILQDILKLPYLKHFAQFVNAMCILLSSKISTEDIDFAEVLLKEFCINARNLYGDEICTFNLHLLFHAPDCVRNWGPLWCYSLFQFEHTNGVITKYFSGTRQICMQILRKVILAQQVMSLGTVDFKNDMATNFFIALLENKRYSSKVLKCGLVTFLGPKRKYVFNEREIKKLKNFGLDELSFGWSFKYFLFNCKKFCSDKYDTVKHCNSVIKIDSQIYLLLKVLIVKQEGVDTPIIFAKKITAVSLFDMKLVSKVVRVSECSRVFELSRLENVKFLCSFSDEGNLMYITELPNSQEIE